MDLELFFANKCGTSEQFAHRIIDFKAEMPVKGEPGKTKTVEHNKEQGLINFDFAKEGILKLLGDESAGLRIFPALDNNGELTVIITAYTKNADELYSSDGKLLADCCPQPPPPFNKTSTLYHKLFDK